MFGLKIFAKSKTKKFASDKERKQYFAIQDYYKKKNLAIPKTNDKKDRK